MYIQDFVVQAQAASWDVYVIATPQATKFIDIPLLEKLTGHRVRAEYRHPEEPENLPRANALVVAPATFNTINKWVQGIADTLAVGLLCEYMGLEMPIIAVPCVPSDHLARHPVFSHSLSLLKECGVALLYEPEKQELLSCKRKTNVCCGNEDVSPRAIIRDNRCRESPHILQRKV